MMVPDFDEAHRPPLTHEDRAALRPLGDNRWTVNGRTISLRDVLNAWSDAEERAMHATATPDLDARVKSFLSANLPTDSETLRAALGTLRAQEAKGRGKYGTDLDGAGLSALALNSHKIQELADALMYAVAEQKAIESLAARVAELERKASMLFSSLVAEQNAHSLTRAQHQRTLAKNDRLRRHIERLITICRARKAEVKNLVWRDEAATRERVGWIEECQRLTARVAELEAENERLKALYETPRVTITVGPQQLNRIPDFVDAEVQP